MLVLRVLWGNIAEDEGLDQDTVLAWHACAWQEWPAVLTVWARLYGRLEVSGLAHLVQLQPQHRYLLFPVEQIGAQHDRQPAEHRGRPLLPSKLEEGGED